MMRDYMKIEAWKLSDDLTVAIYERTRAFPREEVYGLTAQLRRAAYSVPANIAEGSARESKRDYLHFLYIARSSLISPIVWAIWPIPRQRPNTSFHQDLAEHIQMTFSRLHGLIRSVQKECNE